MTKKLTRIQRPINIRLACAYRTISEEGAGVVAETIGVRKKREERFGGKGYIRSTTGESAESMQHGQKGRSSK